MVRIRKRRRQRIAEHSCCLPEPDAMLTLVCYVFARAHSNCIRIQYTRDFPIAMDRLLRLGFG